MEWSCLEDAQKALKEKKTYDTWQEGLLQIFYAVRENKPFIMNVYHCVDRAQVEKYLTPLTDELLMGVIEEKSRGECRCAVRIRNLLHGSFPTALLE